MSEEIERHKQDRRWTSTKSCTDATLPESRAYCDAYFKLRAELASGIEAGRIDRSIQNLKAEINRLRDSGAGQAADPQVSLLARLFGHAESRVRLVLIVVVAVLVEIGSALGLFLATSHGALFARREVPGAGKSSNMEETQCLRSLRETKPDAEAASVGDVVDFALEQLWPQEDGLLTDTKLYEAYRRWCDEGGCGTIGRQEFDTAFAGIAISVGIPVSGNHYRGIELRSAEK